MSHYDRFIEYLRSEHGDFGLTDIVHGPDSIVDTEKLLFGYGMYVLENARYLKPNIQVDVSVRMDHQEHKEHVVYWDGKYLVGGREYVVPLDKQKPITAS